MGSKLPVFSASTSSSQLIFESLSPPPGLPFSSFVGRLPSKSDSGRLTFLTFLITFLMVLTPGLAVGSVAALAAEAAVVEGELPLRGEPETAGLEAGA